MRTPVSIPKVGSEVYVHPAGSSEPWKAIVVGYTPGGEMRVRSAREGSTTVQTVGRVHAVTAEVQS